MRRKGVVVKVVLFTIALVAATLAPNPGESGAEARDRIGARISVRVGDRSRMHIIRPMRLRERAAILRALAARPDYPGGRGARPYVEQHQWFWQLHDPARAGASAARWFEPIETMRRRRALGKGMTPRAVIREIAAAYGPLIATAAQEYKVSEALILAVIAVESRGQVQARSNKGAQGLMQLIPATAARFGVDDSFDPQDNIGGGVAYLDWLLGQFNGDVILALAGYNAGEGAVERNDGVPPYAETRDYVVKVLDALVEAERLCPIPPQGPRRPCPWDDAGELAPPHRADDRAPRVEVDIRDLIPLPPPRPDLAARARPAHQIALPDFPPPDPMDRDS